MTEWLNYLCEIKAPEVLINESPISIIHYNWDSCNYISQIVFCSLMGFFWVRMGREKSKCKASTISRMEVRSKTRKEYLFAVLFNKVFKHDLSNERTKI